MIKYKQTEYKSRCPRCAENGRDTSGDNLHNYGEGRGSFCHACGFVILSDEERDKRGLNNFDEFYEESMGKELITQEELDEVKETTGTKGHGLRGITDSTLKTYAVRHAYSAEDGKPIERYYPCFINGGLSGFKVRILPKDFTTIGKVGKDCELFGYFKFKQSRGKYVVLALGGEEDAMATYQMLADYNKSKGSDFENIPVVSGVVGENGADKQVQNNYEWFNKFEKIVVIRDMDEAGEKALHKVVKVLPKGKVFVTELPLKDPSDMLQQGKEKQFLDCFFKAKVYTPNGILASTDIMNRVVEEAKTEKIPLPPFMHKLQHMMAGGIPLGVIVNMGSASGTGKSTICDEMTYYWIFNSPHMISVVTLESDAGQWGINLLSRHISQKINLIEDIEDKISMLESEDIKEKSKDLWTKEDGTPRFYIVEERDGSLDSLKEQIMQLVIACDCKVIILDPLQDILDGLSNEDQAVFLKWQKGLVKSHKITFININHVRKSGGGQKANSTGADLHEEDFQGSSAIFKSGACNLIFTRDKEAEDEIERNTTKMKASKIRWTGKTGGAGEYYYDNETHTVHDKDDYFNSRGGEFYG